MIVVELLRMVVGDLWVRLILAPAISRLSARFERGSSLPAAQRCAAHCVNESIVVRAAPTTELAATQPRVRDVSADTQSAERREGARRQRIPRISVERSIAWSGSISPLTEHAPLSLLRSVLGLSDTADSRAPLSRTPHRRRSLSHPCRSLAALAPLAFCPSPPSDCLRSSLPMGNPNSSDQSDRAPPMQPPSFAHDEDTDVDVDGGGDYNDEINDTDDEAADGRGLQQQTQRHSHPRQHDGGPDDGDADSSDHNGMHSDADEDDDPHPPPHQPLPSPDPAAGAPDPSLDLDDDIDQLADGLQGGNPEQLQVRHQAQPERHAAVRAMLARAWCSGLSDASVCRSVFACAAQVPAPPPPASPASSSSASSPVPAAIPRSSLEPDDPSVPCYDRTITGFHTFTEQQVRHRRTEKLGPECTPIFDLLGCRWQIDLYANRTETNSVGLYLHYIDTPGKPSSEMSPYVVFRIVVFHRDVVAETDALNAQRKAQHQADVEAQAAAAASATAQAVPAPPGDFVPLSYPANDPRNAENSRNAPFIFRPDEDFGFGGLVPHKRLGEYCCGEQQAFHFRVMIQHPPQAAGRAIRPLKSFIEEAKSGDEEKVRWPYLGLDNQGATW